MKNFKFTLSVFICSIYIMCYTSLAMYACALCSVIILYIAYPHLP